MGNLIKPKVATWGKEEWLYIVKSIVSGKVITGNNITLLSQKISMQYPDSSIFLINSARAGLIASLALFKKNRPEKSQVIIPEFICDSVPQAIKKCGLTPVYLPVSKGLNLDISLLHSISHEKTLAVILPHMYGKIAEISQAEVILKAKSIYLIDDAAQVAGVNVEGKPLGTFGDIGVLSFAQAKTIVTGVRASGGVLLVNNNNLKAALTQSLDNLPISAGRLGALFHFLMAYQWQGVWKPIDYYIQRLKAKIVAKKTRYYAQISQISNMEAGIALAQFASLEKRISSTKINIKRYQKNQQLFSTFAFPQITQDNIYLTRLIIQSKNIPPRVLAKVLLQQGIASREVYSTGSKPFDGSYLSGLLELPLQNISVAEIDTVTRVLQKIEGDLPK